MEEKTKMTRWIVIAGVVVVVFAILAVGAMMLITDIAQKKAEARQLSFRVTELTESTIDPVEWGKNFPHQYDTYTRTVDTVRTRHGGSEAFQKLDDDPRWRELFRGYAFGIDYREDRGHAYMLSDQRETDRVTKKSQPGACLQCHASVIPAYHKVGVSLGVPDDAANRQKAIMKGFEEVCSWSYEKATALVKHPITCLDCHNPKTMQLRVTRPAFITGIQKLAESPDPVPHLPSIERWRKGDRETPYDANTMATRQEMRVFACGQCHVEYYFKGPRKTLTYPWHNGLKVEQSEKYYNTVAFADWKHKSSKAPMLKAQHPEFELWSQGVHARAGVTCVDCHMPYTRIGATKVSDHQVRSPLLNINRACQPCHSVPETELKARVIAIQDRTKKLMIRAEEATLDLIRAIQFAEKAGVSDEKLKSPRDFHRRAQYRLDFIAAENSMGFHADQESARILGEAIDYARQGQVSATALLIAGKAS
jgi:nitrite reductase (cytochrome c-552)